MQSSTNDRTKSNLSSSNNGQKSSKNSANVKVEESSIEEVKALSRYKSPTSKKGLFQKTMKKPSNIQTITDPVLGCFRLSKSPENADRNLLLSHKEKLDKYRKFKKPPIDKLSGLKTCRDRFSEVGKIKCTH